jgi:Tfp pilus assembly protein PilF
MDPARRLAPAVLLILVTCAPSLAPGPAASGQSSSGQPASTPPWKRQLIGEDASRVEKLEKQIEQLKRDGRFSDAIGPAREVAEIRIRLQGADHWQAADTRRAVDDLRKIATLPEEGRKAMATVEQVRREAIAASEGARYAEADRLSRRALETCQRWLGEGHPGTLGSYKDLAVNLGRQRKPVEAEPLFRKALAISLSALGKDHPSTAYAYRDIAYNMEEQMRYAEAEAMYLEALPVFLKSLGEDHDEIVRTYESLGGNLYAQGKYAEFEAMARRALAIRLKALGEGHPKTANGYNNLAEALHHQGKHAEAEALHRRALALRLKALPEGHPDIALSYRNLALTLGAQRKYAEAEAMNRRALALRLKALPEGHPDTASSYNNLALALNAQEKSDETEAMHRRALAIRLKALGEGHPDTIVSYDHLTLALHDQGKYAEAEAMARRALAIRLKALGEGHPDSATSYDHLADNLSHQGKYAEAEAMARRALAIQLKALGEGHPKTANGYNNLAVTLRDQGKLAEAEALHRRALAIDIKARGEGHPNTASSYNNLAVTLRAQGKPAEAEAMFRRALAIDIKARGEGHPASATNYFNLAWTLRDQGKSAEAEAMYRRALAIQLEARGEGHPLTARSHQNLAWSLDRQGKHDDALRTWSAAAASYEQARLRGAKGLEAALTADESPFPGFALALARAGRPRDAWTRWEQGLARGLIDEVIGRAARPLTADEHDREALLLGQSQALDERIGRLLAVKAPSQEQDKFLEDLRRQASETRRQVLELEQQFEGKYRALAGQPAALEAVQKALPEGTALVGWIDQDPDHWACLLRHSGDPIWVRLPGAGPDGAWTREQDGLAQRLRAELDPETTQGHALPPAEALARQRLEPLKGHLQGINRLVVVTSPGLAGVPIEVLLAARPDPAWDGVTVSYAPSASMLAFLVGRPTPRDRPPTLLALADPAYPEPTADAPAPAPPEAGLAIARVVPHSNADLNGLRAGDVLLAYAGTALKQHADLKTIPADQGPKRVPVRYWREGITREVVVAAGPLGVAIDRRPAREAVRAGQAADQVLLGMRGGAHARLPGTRREVEAVARLFPAGSVTTVTGARACEATVQGLARSGEMKAFRYLHFAAHGQSDPRHAYRSALILAPDPDRSADPLALEGDGTITAEQIARTWDLDADLVVLSACESGLGRAVGGEGHLGFAQPLFARGARSLVLSLWRVDDKATALLMTRFYQNLLGKWPGLSRPMPKAAALDEARRWLRGLTADEVGSELAALDRGEVRPLAKDSGGAAPGGPPAPGPAAVRPYAHPHYWAAFILIGSPD